MRWSAAAAVLVAFGVFACSSSGGTAAPSDATTGPQPLGGACDPTLAQPCVSSGDECTEIVCDPTSRLCTAMDTDASAPCNATSRACASSDDCDLGDVCGFPITGGCTATGHCIDLPLPCENDAASCAPSTPVCGCDGLPDPVVFPGYATSPVVSASACDGGGLFADAASPPPDAAVALDGGSD